MQKSEFEKNIAEKMEELQFTPSEGLWNSVEAKLPKEKKKRPFILVIFFVAALLAGLLIWNNSEKKKENSSIAIQKNNSSESTLPKEKISSNNNNLDSNLALTSKNAIIIPNKIEKVTKEKATQNNTNNGLFTNENKNVKNNKQLKTNAKVSVAIKSLPPIDEDDMNINAVNYEINTNKNNDETIKAADSNIVFAQKNTGKDSSIKEDVILAKTKQAEKKRSQKKWRYGIDIGAGISTVNNALFENSGSYAYALYSAADMSSSISNPSIRSSQSKPASSLAINLGVYIEREITTRFTFKTGLNYFYQSNSMQVGERVDSIMQTGDKSASKYYRIGNTGSYKNKFHLLEIPLLIDCKFSKKSIFHLEAGPTVAYLMQSNAMVYNERPQGFFTDKDLFNKILLSVNFGASLDLAKKSKYPFSIGYRFKYGINSAIKTNYADQHFVSSLLYLKIPFKK